MSESLRRCLKCGVAKSVAEFRRHKWGLDGSCHECVRRSQRKSESERVAAYQAKRRDQIGDDAWRAERAAYQRKYRAAGPGATKNKLYEKARRAALAELAMRYPDEYEELYAVAKEQLQATKQGSSA